MVFGDKFTKKVLHWSVSTVKASLINEDLLCIESDEACLVISTFDRGNSFLAVCKLVLYYSTVRL